MLVLLAGAETAPDDEAFDQVVRLFDGRDEEAIAEARARGSASEDEGRTLSYWREGDDGWERAR